MATDATIAALCPAGMPPAALAAFGEACLGLGQAAETTRSAWALTECAIHLFQSTGQSGPLLVAIAVLAQACTEFTEQAGVFETALRSFDTSRTLATAQAQEPRS